MFFNIQLSGGSYRNNICILSSLRMWGKQLSPDVNARLLSFVSVTRSADFYKFLAINCLTKVALIILRLWGLFLIMSLFCKKCVATFWAIFGRNKATFCSHWTQYLQLKLSIASENEGFIIFFPVVTGLQTLDLHLIRRFW